MMVSYLFFCLQEKNKIRGRRRRDFLISVV